MFLLHAALGEKDLAFAALEQALVEREFYLAWLPFGRGHMELTSLESDPRWPVFIEKVKAAMQAGASAATVIPDNEKRPGSRAVDSRGA